MTTLTVPARFVGLDLPGAPEETHQQVRDRLLRSQQARAAARKAAADAIPTAPDHVDALLDDLLDGPQNETATACAPAAGAPGRATTWSRRYMRRGTASLAALNHLKTEDRTSILAAARDGRAVGMLGRNRMEELIAELHAVHPSRGSRPSSGNVFAYRRYPPSASWLPPVALLYDWHDGFTRAHHA